MQERKLLSIISQEMARTQTGTQSGGVGEGQEGRRLTANIYRSIYWTFNIILIIRQKK